MTEHAHPHGGGFLITLLSISAGLWSWLSDPMLWRALAVAVLCGLLGGVARGIGQMLWRGIAQKYNLKNREEK
jgi:hypothetical protein